jgi:hypothetical protein
MTRRRVLAALAAIAALRAGPAGGQEPPPAALVDAYARFLGAAAARRHLDDLPFEIGESREQAVTLKSRGQAYRVELMALDAADNCEACSGQVDAFVFRDGAPFFLEKGVFDGGSHGRVYTGDRTAVLPLSRDTDGLVVTGEMWAPRGCRFFAAHVFAVDPGGRTLRKVFDRVEESCEGSREVTRLALDGLGLDGQGRGKFSLTLVRRQGRREVKTTEPLRFDPGRWVLVKP